jgi:hypothetical protein
MCCWQETFFPSLLKRVSASDMLRPATSTERKVANAASGSTEGDVHPLIEITKAEMSIGLEKI